MKEKHENEEILHLSKEVPLIDSYKPDVKKVFLTKWKQGLFFSKILTSLSWMLAPFRNKISTISPSPIWAARCNGVWNKSIKNISQPHLLSMQSYLLLKNVSDFRFFICQYGNHLPLPIHVYSAILTSENLNLPLREE